MKVTYILGAAGLASAAALPATSSTDLDADLLDAILSAPVTSKLGPSPDEYSAPAPARDTTPKVVDSGNGDLDKRDLNPNWDCVALPAGAGPSISPDTADAFVGNTALDSTQATTPPNYSLAFSNHGGSTQQIGYRGLYSLSSYDPTACASHCDADNLCQGFNIYYERDPTVRPADDGNGGGCPNPPSTTQIKCTLYGYKVSTNSTTNVGQYQAGFHVVIAGSNGYNKNSYTPPDLTSLGFTSLGGLPGATVDNLSYSGFEAYTDVYDPTTCAQGCNRKTQWHKDHDDPNTTPEVCEFFNSWVLYKDSVPAGTMCSYYKNTATARLDQGSNQGQWQGSVHVTIDTSYIYALTSTVGQ